MVTLGIDIETYSPAELGDTGVYPYAEHPAFEILLFGYAFDSEPVRVIDLKRGEALPERVMDALYSHSVIKTAYNALFERVCINRYLRDAGRPHTPVAQWLCTMAEAGRAGLPMSLGETARALSLDERKMDAGKALVRYFSLPCRPTKTNGGRTRNLPEHDPAKWELYRQYNAQDVEVERAIRKQLQGLQRPAPFEEMQLYVLDQMINDRGIRIDLPFVEKAIALDAACRERLLNEARELTGLDNPNSTVQMKAYIEKSSGREIESLNRGAVGEMLEDAGTDDATRRALELRSGLSRTSVKKYEAMRQAVRRDGRIGGLFQFYGANRTGRWSGRLVQLQNLPQNHLQDLELARELVRTNDGELLEILFGDVPDTLSQLVRTAFVPEPGYLFTVADFSAIEARVIAWLAGEEWRLDVFRSHGKIYEASASQMFGVPVEEITKGSLLRQKGKVAELALGYQGGANALVSMGALKMGLKEDELPALVSAWRTANPAIVRLWDTVNRAAMQAVERQSSARIFRDVTFRYSPGMLYVDLPSGRSLAYVHPRIGENRFGGRAILYEGMDQTTRKWGAQETYGGKLVENCVQAIARDCLAEAMLRLHGAGYRIVMHVHDEVVIEHPEAEDCREEACSIMCEPIPWAEGLPLRAEGFTAGYYRKG
jgi:DNA polymerase